MHFGYLEVDQFEISSGPVVEDVLWFDVSMADTVPV